MKAGFQFTELTEECYHLYSFLNPSHTLLYQACKLLKFIFIKIKKLLKFTWYFRKTPKL